MKTEYPIDPKLDLANRFTYHKPHGDQNERYVAIREAAKEFAKLLARLTPPSREQSTAITKLDEAVMMANAAIARNEPAPEEG